MGIAEDAASTVTLDGNTFELGTGGAGGTSPVGGLSDGANGVVADHHKLLSEAEWVAMLRMTRTR